MLSVVVFFELLSFETTFKDLKILASQVVVKILLLASETRRKLSKRIVIAV